MAPPPTTCILTSSSIFKQTLISFFTTTVQLANKLPILDLFYVTSLKMQL